jgi:hypothetical protein
MPFAKVFSQFSYFIFAIFFGIMSTVYGSAPVALVLIYVEETNNHVNDRGNLRTLGTRPKWAQREA